VEIDALEAVKTLVLDPDQEQFAGSLDTVFDGLQDSRHHDSQHAFVVVAGNEMVGFFILREKSALPNWAPGGGITLHSFRIRRDRQGMGFGKAAIGLAICWVRQNRPDVGKLMLAVNARNLSARSLYLKSGFVDEGAIFHGPIGDQNILTFHLKNAES
jgi:cysteine synthase A